ncbi:MAG: hypothetical protein ACE5G1_17455 [bacterium]
MKKFLLLLLVLMIACSEQQENADNNQDMAVITQSNAGLSWQIPSDWIEEKPTSTMRAAQFRLPKAEADTEDANVVVFYFQGEGGGVRANIQRWISQFKLPEGELTREVTEEAKTEVNGLTHTLVDIRGTYLFRPMPMAANATEKPGFRMLAAVIEGGAGPWFVRFVGPEATVAKWENSFRKFLGSFKQA